MARPTKQAMDYFSMDTKFDDKTVLYLLETEAVGLAVLVTSWQLIYGNMGYFAINGDDFSLLVKQRISVDINRVNECINSCLRRDLFSQELHDRYGILTSRGIQKRYFEVGKVRKAVEFVPEFMLLDVSEYKNLVNVPINSVNGLRKYTKESKGKETKEKETKIQEESEKPKPLALRPPYLSEDVWDQFKLTRGKPLTILALKGIEREATKAGLTVEEAMTKSIEGGWRGFKAEWVKDKKNFSRGDQHYENVRRATINTLTRLTDD